jgi:WD40 repeat protein
MADAIDVKLAKEVKISGIHQCLARVKDSERIYFGSSDFKVYELDLAADKPQPVPLQGQHDSYVTGLVLTADGQLVSGGYDGRLLWWDTGSRQVVRSVDAHRRWIRRVAISPDGTVVASVADDMACRLWNAGSGSMLHELLGHEAQTPHHYPSMLFCCAFSADGKLLATADKPGNVVIWDTSGGKEVARFTAEGFYTWDPTQRRHSIGGIRSVAFSHDGSLLAAGGISKIGNVDHLDGRSRIELWDWRRGQQVALLESDKNKGLVERLVFGPDDAWLLAAGGAHGGLLQFVDLKARKYTYDDKAPMHVHDVALNETHDRVYAVGHDAVCLWTL